MGALTPFALAAMIALAHPGATHEVTDWRPFVAEASRRFDVPVVWIERVMQAESAGRTMLYGRPITSRVGAMGLMQLMPDTWAAMRRRLDLGGDPFDPHDNILAGSLYLRMMYDRFGYPGMFAAYNAGPGRYAAILDGLGPLPDETRLYLARVTGVGERKTVPAIDARRSGLFVHRDATAQGFPSSSTSQGIAALFAVSGRN